MRSLFIAGMLAVFVFAAWACSGKDQASLGKEIVMTKCTTCHANLITCQRLGEDEDYWMSTNKRMMDKGMDMTQEELEAVTAYLADLPPGSSPVCD
jgi:cytochrome c5